MCVFSVVVVVAVQRPGIVMPVAVWSIAWQRVAQSVRSYTDIHGDTETYAHTYIHCQVSLSLT